MENPIKIHDLGGKPQFLETPMSNCFFRISLKLSQSSFFGTVGTLRASVWEFGDDWCCWLGAFSAVVNPLLASVPNWRK